MSTNAAFKLQDAGFTRQQVEALSEFTDTQAASKADLQASEHRLETIITAVRSDLDASEHRLETKIADVKASLEAKISAVQASLDSKIVAVQAGLETKIEAAKADTLKWIIGLILGGVVINALTIVGAMLSLFKALGH
jgi:stress response protein YsnF